MNQPQGARELLDKPKRYTTIILILVLLSGAIGAAFSGYSFHSNNKRFLMQRALTVADNLPLDEIETLRTDPKASRSASYTDLKARLRQTRLDNQDLRFVYLMAKQGNKVYFLVDSEDPTSPAYSPYGQEYTQASPALRAAFDNGKPYVEGPLTDVWGTRLAGLAPITDPRTNKIIAVAGMVMFTLFDPGSLTTP